MPFYSSIIMPEDIYPMFCFDSQRLTFTVNLRANFVNLSHIENPLPF